MDRRHLETKLASIVQAARGQEAQNLTPGATAFVLLNLQSEELVAAFSARWPVTLEQLNAELPVQGKLRQLAHPPAAQQTRIAYGGLIVVAAVTLSFLLGLAAACARLGYHLLGGGR